MFLWIVLLGGIIGYYVYDVIRKQQYWKAKGIPSLFPYPIVGQIPQFITLGQGEFDQKWIRKLGRIFGFSEGSEKFLVVADAEILRNVLVKDFSHFVDRWSIDGLNGEIIAKSVLELKGQHWKDVRSILAPAFTSGKMRQMNPLILDCCTSLLKNMENIANSGEEYEAKELYGRVTLDVIAAAFFGTKIDSQTDSQNAFVVNAKRAFDISAAQPLFIIAFLFPNLVPLALKLGLEGMSQSAIGFFAENTKEILRMRVQNPQSNHKDFLQLMLKSLRSDEIHLSRNKSSTGSVTTTQVRSTEKEEDNGVDIISQDIVHFGDSVPTPHSDYKLTTEELIAQSVIFFIAGYETTASALAFLTYNLALNADIQEKLRREVVRVMTGHDYPAYDLIAEMKYLDMCVNETLRLFPPLSRALRECTDDWHSGGLYLDKGTRLIIPIFAIQRDPEYWPNPEVFDPERFSPENKQNIKPYTFQAFGQGPRHCVGMRFAVYEIKMVMASVLLKYRIVPSARTEVPLLLKDINFVYAKNGIWTKLEKL